MDRKRYINSQDYRDGYDKGVEDGREQVKKQMEHTLDEITNVLRKVERVELQESELENPFNNSKFGG